MNISYYLKMIVPFFMLELLPTVVMEQPCEGYDYYEKYANPIRAIFSIVTRTQLKDNKINVKLIMTCIKSFLPIL